MVERVIRLPLPASDARVPAGRSPGSASEPQAAASAPARLSLTASRQFPEWLHEQRLSFAFTTYQAGKLFMIGLGTSGRLSIFERTFNRCMGLCADPRAQSLWMSSLYQLWRFENVLAPGEAADGYDRVYVPQVGYTTGDLDIHDLAIGADGRPIFVNTLFGCVATLSETHSFAPIWKPPFLSALVPEDRCHLNGLALDRGRPRYVTAVSESDVADGWRDRRVNGGCVIDVDANAVVLRGLSMPHSPRLYEGRLWLLESGTGQFGWADLKAGRFEPVAFCPGYARGLAFAGRYAVIGLSRPRENKTFQGLPLDERMKTHDAETRCGLIVVDTRTGALLHWLRIEGVVEELYDIALLPAVRRPKAVGFKTDEIRRVLSVAPSPLEPLLRES